MIWVFRSYSSTKSIDKSSSIDKLMSLTNSHCAIFNSQCFHYVRFNKCSNTLYSCTEMSKFLNTWIECWNVRMLFKLVCVLLLVFFLHAEVLFVLKMLVAGKRKYNHRTLLEKRQATKMYQLNIMYLRTLYRPGLRTQKNFLLH